MTHSVTSEVRSSLCHVILIFITDTANVCILNRASLSFTKILRLSTRGVQLSPTDHQSVSKTAAAFLESQFMVILQTVSKVRKFPF